MTRYVGIMYDDREPEHIMERFVSSIRDEVKEKIDGVFRDFTDPDDGVRPSHLQYAIDEEPAVSLLLNQEELKALIDIVDEASISKYGRIIHRISNMLSGKLKCFKE
jgi:hypothetical protein